PADGVLEAWGRDVRPEATPDLEQPVGNERRQGLADGRPADPVLLHQLRLRRDLGAGSEPAVADPVAQVRLDLAIERQPGGRGRRHPLIPVNAIPRTNWRWAMTNRTIIGITLTSAPAISSGHLPTYWPCNSDSPAVSVKDGMSRR